jgi:hypothetical protein
MQRTVLPLWAILVLVAFATTGCGQSDVAAAEADRPATIEHIEGSDLSKVTLTDQAAERIGLETAPVQTAGGTTKTVPYAAVLYDGQGEAWVYTNPGGLTFVRTKVAISKIEGDTARLSDGPPPGTVVATVGVAEIFGAEMGVGDPE